jgi:hypothetical protein
MTSNSVTDEIAAALRDSMSPRDRLASWTFRWSVLCGQLVCAQCQASQSANQLEASFVHRPGCRARREDKPWRELDSLLGAVAMRQPLRR